MMFKLQFTMGENVCEQRRQRWSAEWKRETEGIAL